MALVSDFKDRYPNARTIEGRLISESGSCYYIQTDRNGVVSCSCLSWLHPSKKKGPAKRIEERWCKHLEGLLWKKYALLDPATLTVTTVEREAQDADYVAKHGALEQTAPTKKSNRPKRKYQ